MGSLVPGAVGVHARMRLPPRPAPLRAVPLGRPFARATKLQPRAVDRRRHGPGIVACTYACAGPSWPRHLKRFGPAAGTGSRSPARRGRARAGDVRAGEAAVDRVGDSARRHGRPEARCGRCTVWIATSGWSRGRPRWPVRGGRRAAIAPGATRAVTTPRRCGARSYPGQFTARWRVRGIEVSWRRGPLDSWGIRRARKRRCTPHRRRARTRGGIPARVPGSSERGVSRPRTGRRDARDKARTSAVQSGSPRPSPDVGAGPSRPGRSTGEPRDPRTIATLLPLV